jgi:glycosyltransferase involved in cell wall biosynthesis
LIPDDLDGWSKAMKDILDDDLRKSLIEKGYKNIERFSWEHCALQTLDVFKKVLEST